MSMISNDAFIAASIADQSSLSANQVLSSVQVGFGETPPAPLDIDYEGWNPIDTAVDTTQKAVVTTFKAKEEETKENEKMTRLAMAIAEAMKAPVEVGKVRPDGKVEGEPLAPATLPEPRSSIKAGVEAVGKVGRKAVFSELPFDAEDIPTGWEVMKSQSGGWYAAPPEDAEEVMTLDAQGDRASILGYTSDVPEESDGTVVKVRNKDGATVQDVTVDKYGSEDHKKAATQAQALADEIGGTVEHTTAPLVLDERIKKFTEDKLSEALDTIVALEGNVGTVYKDSQNLSTVGLGFNMERQGAKRDWLSSGIPEDFDKVKAGEQTLSVPSREKLLVRDLIKSSDSAQRRANELGVDWKSLPEWHKTILTDIAYNTGSVSQWKNVFLNKTPTSVLREARRLEGGKNTKGMDNRVARLGLMLGIINSQRQARELGLELTDLKPTEVAQLIQMRRKAQPTRGDV